MNSSFFTADRSTHIKILIMAVVASLIVTTVAINARNPDIGSQTAQIRIDGVVIKAVTATRYSTTDTSLVR